MKGSFFNGLFLIKKLRINEDKKMNNKIIGTILFIFLMVVATLGMFAFILQTAFGEPITFVEFFQMIKNR